jgi:hypothetical protein
MYNVFHGLSLTGILGALQTLSLIIDTNSNNLKDIIQTSNIYQSCCRYNYAFDKISSNITSKTIYRKNKILSYLKANGFTLYLFYKSHSLKMREIIIYIKY